MIVLFVMLMLYQNAKQYERISYNSVNEFKEKSDIDYYELYDACAYIFNGQKVLISDSDEFVLSHYKNEENRYSIDHYKQREQTCAYDIRYEHVSFDYSLDALHHKINNDEIIIDKDINGNFIHIIYTSDSLSYAIALYVSDIDTINLKDYESKIINYIQDNNKLKDA